MIWSLSSGWGWGVGAGAVSSSSCLMQQLVFLASGDLLLPTPSPPRNLVLPAAGPVAKP